MYEVTIKKILEPKDEDFGPLLPFIKNDMVTDIEIVNHELWITDLEKGTYEIKNTEITELFIERFTNMIGNRVNAPFNQNHKVLEAETDTLRIEIVHECVSIRGRCIFIRKVSSTPKLDITSMIKTGYCEKEVLALLINCVIAKMNFVFCGETGVGKTENMKFFTQYINASDTVVTIEDTPELHYCEINPGHHGIALKINEDDFTYEKAIRTALRLHATWIIVPEARGVEIKEIIKSLLSGCKGMVTIHTDDVRTIVSRMVEMTNASWDVRRLENNIYRGIDVGVLIEREWDENAKKMSRHIEQVCFFDRSGEENKIYMVVDDGKLISKELPPYMTKKMKKKHITNPFKNKYMEESE